MAVVVNNIVHLKVAKRVYLTRPRHQEAVCVPVCVAWVLPRLRCHVAIISQLKRCILQTNSTLTAPRKRCFWTGRRSVLVMGVRRRLNIYINAVTECKVSDPKVLGCELDLDSFVGNMDLNPDF